MKRKFRLLILSSFLPLLLGAQAFAQNSLTLRVDSVDHPLGKVVAILVPAGPGKPRTAIHLLLFNEPLSALDENRLAAKVVHFDYKENFTKVIGKSPLMVLSLWQNQGVRKCSQAELYGGSVQFFEDRAAGIPKDLPKRKFYGEQAERYLGERGFQCQLSAGSLLRFSLRGDTSYPSARLQFAWNLVGQVKLLR